MLEEQVKLKSILEELKIAISHKDKQLLEANADVDQLRDDCCELLKESSERDALLTERDDLLSKLSVVDELRAECNQLRADNENHVQMKAERDQLRAERDQLRVDREQLRAECDQLREENASLKQSVQSQTALVPVESPSFADLDLPQAAPCVAWRFG